MLKANTLACLRKGKHLSAVVQESVNDLVGFQRPWLVANLVCALMRNQSEYFKK